MKNSKRKGGRGGKEGGEEERGKERRKEKGRREGGRRGRRREGGRRGKKKERGKRKGKKEGEREEGRRKDRKEEKGRRERGRKPELDLELNIGRFMCPPFTPNAFLGHLCASRSHFEHPRLENTVIYKGKSSNTGKKLESGEGTMHEVRSLSTKVGYHGRGDGRKYNRF